MKFSSRFLSFVLIASSSTLLASAAPRDAPLDNLVRRQDTGATTSVVDGTTTEMPMCTGTTLSQMGDCTFTDGSTGTVSSSAVTPVPTSTAASDGYSGIIK